MRILFTSIVGTGHITPLLPYAKEMLRQGHEVRVAAPGELAEKIARAGLAHVPTVRPSKAERDAFFDTIKHLTSSEWGAAVMSGFFVGLLPRTSYPELLRFAEEWRPDLIVRDSGEFAGPLVAAKLGIPHIRVSVCNGHKMLSEIPAFDALRQEFGLAPDGGSTLRQARAFSSFPVSMEPPNGDAAALPQFRVAPVATVVSGARPDWMSETDQKHIYVTFGTVVVSMDKGIAMMRAALEAVGRMDLQALMTTGGMDDISVLGDIPDNVILRDFVPQDEVFPHVSAVLCHGGSGSVLGALAAGLPLVIAPVGADQPDNAATVTASGAGLSVDVPEADALAHALQNVLSDPVHAAAAKRISAEMAAYPSIEEAVVEMLRQTSAGKD